MEGQTFSLTPINEQGRQWIQVDESAWNEKYGVKTNSRRGFFEVKVPKAQFTLKALKDGELQAVLGSRIATTGLHEVQLIGVEEEIEVEAPAGTLSH